MSEPRRRLQRLPGETVAQRRVAIEGSRMTFVVRLTRDKGGRITGVIEQVRTGLKARVEGLDAVSKAIGEMIEPPGTDEGQGPPGAAGSR